jgi:preprotein translocase subunit SecG
MGKHEIRLRRQRMTARGSERFRNYGAVLKQYGVEKRMKIITRIFTFIFLILALVLVFIVVSRWEENRTNPLKKTSQPEVESQHNK